jgi:hypothetical protein
MNEQYQKLIEKAGFYLSKPMVVGYVWCSDEYPIDEELINLINVVRSYEREAILKLADSLGWVSIDDIEARGNK